AGIADPSDSSILGEDNTTVGEDNMTAVFEWVMRVNVLRAPLGTKHAGRAMVAAGRGGSIIITASLASAVGAMGHPVYSRSKHAVVGLERNTAADLGKHGVRVNCVSPGIVPTPLTESHYQASEEELEALGEVIS
ncbi:momilactone A synthase-like, partial [Curcuma longa]|uniref:momilactone A synthase-like n=1 Tax=Curcuma longa TaxID=136217 RepID=UPI003D9EC8A3